VEELRKKERSDETQFTTKIGGKTTLGLWGISFCKIFIPSYTFDALLLCQNWPFSPPESHDFTDNSSVCVLINDCLLMHQ
jgi:hypothetical protein